MGSHDDLMDSMACRLCFGACRVMMTLTPTPIANSFPELPDKKAKCIPLEIQECITCGHVQQKYRPPIDWVDYRYQTPEANRRHLALAAEAIRFYYPHAKTVMEIGCNNGLYLEELKRVGFEAFGVDPNTTVGVSAPFSAVLANDLGEVDVIVANNVLAHVDDLWDVFRGIDKMLPLHGALVFEVQDFDDLCEKGAFDMLYHEHRDYHTVDPLGPFLKKFGLEIERLDSLETHGGSKRYWCRRPYRWRTLSQKMEKAKRAVLEQISEVDGRVAAFGATAKACTLIHHFGLVDLIDYCVDDTPQKQGRYIPGTNIPIYPTSYLNEVPPEAVLMTAWNFKDVLKQKYPQLHWIIPFEEALCR